VIACEREAASALALRQLRHAGRGTDGGFSRGADFRAALNRPPAHRLPFEVDPGASAGDLSLISTHARRHMRTMHTHAKSETILQVTQRSDVQTERKIGRSRLSRLENSWRELF
jgi:hypothetical protein